MIYSLKHQFVFIHIPRTGGTSITETLAGQCWDATVDVFELKHATAEDLRVRFLSDVWHSLYRFTVVRNPWDIIASDYRHTLMAAEQIDARTSLYCTAEWMA
ncbi:MAG: sulfotransferase family 2 domain-containing protein, partial [Planctomycetota bacterium]|nr:sulfotransferase family 2 domain-containing protein [Planctomycetota bacterium]